MSQSFNASTAAEQLNASCQLAWDVVMDPYAICARFVFIGFNLVVFLLIPLLIHSYKKYPPALHSNLKLLYANIVFSYAISSSSYLLVEFRHLYLMLFQSSSPCAMLCPLWLASLSRMPSFFQGGTTPMLHFAVMLERARATAQARRYEAEGLYFGILATIISYLVGFFTCFAIWFMTMVDLEWHIDKQLPFNSLATPSSSQISIYFCYFFLLLIAFTAVGDFLVIRMCIQKRRKNIFNPITTTAIETKSKVREIIHHVEYSLSENYQLQENILAIRYILPLDIAYVVSFSIYNLTVIVIRTFLLQKPPIFLASYNLTTCFQLLYTIVSLFYYRRFLLSSAAAAGGDNSNNCRPSVHQPRGRRRQTEDNAATRELGKIYFAQLASQWQ